MRTFAVLCTTVILLNIGPVAKADETDRERTKEVLTSTIEALEERLKGDEKALAKLEKLKKPNDEQLDEMARKLKINFELDDLKPNAIKKVKVTLDEKIKATDREKLSTALIENNAKPVPFLCWLVRCP